MYFCDCLQETTKYAEDEYKLTLYFKNIEKKRTVQLLDIIDVLACTVWDVVTVTDETFMTVLWWISTMSFCFPFQIFILLQFTCNCCLKSYEQYICSIFFCYWYALWITFHFNVYIKDKCYFWFFLYIICLSQTARVFIFLSDWQCSNFEL